MDHDARGVASSPWPKLPADVLSEIAARLHDAGDFVRFRAACRPWHEALPPARAPSFLPWILEEYDSSIDDPHVLLCSPFSASRTRHLLPLPAIRGTSIKGSDASGGRVLAVPDEGRTAALVNPLDVRDAASLPPVPQRKSWRDRWGSASGAVVSSNGAVVFHTLQHREDHFFAAIQLRPGEPSWEKVDTYAVGWHMSLLDDDERRAAALWSSAVVPGAACRVAALPPRPRGSSRFLLEFRGELLCVDVVLRPRPNLASVRVHAKRAEDDGWRSRGDTDHLCLFLGLRSSLAMDARESPGSVEVSGGCAYFFLRRQNKERVEQTLGRIHLYRYSFRSDTATFVDELNTVVIPTWFVPRPRMSPLLPRVQ
ncbi:uncharacterized protein LOC120648171 [Panicum virgatum]|uniref:uncharacterized protein LOC120648171 n=1 Tax=Panicum virgatum TaxID=38727 RepID=UPI0019D5A2B6|nr:uncharacterized protein LOC120648171 [Panicum virgatum]